MNSDQLIHRLLREPPPSNVQEDIFRGCAGGCSLSRSDRRLSSKDESTLRNAQQILQRLKETSIDIALLKHAA